MTKEQRIAMEIAKFHGDRNRMNQFLGKGIVIQNDAYSATYAAVRKNFTCEVLTTCGFCCNHRCETCKLEMAYTTALKEIAEGKRVKDVNDGIYNYGARRFCYRGHKTEVMHCDSAKNTKENK